MSESSGGNPSELSALHLAVMAQEARKQVTANDLIGREPIAIISVALRFPGSCDTSEKFWRLLATGGDAISEVPGDRWDVDALYDPDPMAPGKICSRWGGFLDQIDQFDADFFGISPREAEQMDPRQRLVIEVGWEALERAGYTRSALSGSKTAVFVGMSSSEFILHQLTDIESIDAYAATGSCEALLANRLSYLFDLRGPSVAIDTACSSSLVAAHLGCMALRAGDADLCVVGGVQVLLAPQVSISLSRWGALSPTGRCRTFDQSADGFVRGEGCGILVLKRLSDAVRDQDNILALIRGSSVNQDGRSAGLTAPNLKSQEAVIREALQRSGISPASVDYIEAHGTATALGDPIEVEALHNVLGRVEGERLPCRLGSVKANIGHLEGAAGVSGIIKVVLSLLHEMIPPLPHFRSLNPNIDLRDSRLEIATRPTPWKRGKRRRFAGVSGFGIGGTNAHLIIEESPALPVGPSVPDPDRSNILVITAPTPSALNAAAQAYVAALSQDMRSTPATAIAYNAANRRTHYSHRLAVVGSGHGAWQTRLEEYLSGKSEPGLSAGIVDGARRRPLVFVFSPQGSEWFGMGRQLVEEEPAFRDSITACDAAMRERLGWSVLDQITLDTDHAWLADTRRLYPALFAIQVGLAALFRAWGIEPDIVVGLGIGEISAAHVAGVLSLKEAVDIIHLQESTMAAGSPRGEAARTGLATLLSGPRPQPGHIPFFSPRAGDVIDGRTLDATYWSDHLARSTSFGPALSRLIQSGHDIFVELGPHPLLAPTIADGLRAHARAGRVLGSLHREEPERDAMLRTVGFIFVEGVSVDWPKLFQRRERGIDLPGYVWQRRRHWIERNLDLPSRRLPRGSHPHLVRRVDSAAAPNALVWEIDFNGPRARYLGDHRIRGSVVVPAASFLEIALFSASEVLVSPSIALRDVEFHEALFPDANERMDTQLVIEQEGNETLRFRIMSRRGAGRPWTLHVSGQAERDHDFPNATPHGITTERGERTFDSESHYSRFTRSGIIFGPSFRGVDGISVEGSEIAAEISLPASASSDGFLMHPVWIDLCLQPLAATFPITESSNALFLPASARCVRIGTRRPRDRARVFATVAARQLGSEIESDIVLVDGQMPVLLVEGFRARKVDPGPQQRDLGNWLCRLAWQRKALEQKSDTGGAYGRWLILGDPEGLGERMAAHLAAAGASVEIWKDAREVAGPAAVAERFRLENDPIRGILYLRSLDVGMLDVDALDACYLPSLLHLVQGLVGGGPAESPRVWIVTRNSQLVVKSDRVAPAAAAIYGFARTAALEHPEFRFARVDFGVSEENEAFRLRDEILNSGKEDQIAWRENTRYVARLEAGTDQLGALLQGAERSRAELKLVALGAANATYLVVGGLGGVGFLLVQWMIERGARHIFLMSRHPPSGEKKAKIEAWNSVGRHIVVSQGDVSRREDVDRVILEIRRSGRPLKGIIHNGVVLDDGILMHQSAARLRTVTEVKARGSLNLHDATTNDPLEFFVLFSSASSILGSPGQGGYSPANAFQDGLAFLRRSMGLPGLSISWGPWSDVGLAAKDSEKFRSRGFDAIEPSDGLRLLGLLLYSQIAHIGAFSFDASRWNQLFPQTRGAPFLANLATVDRGELHVEGKLRTALAAIDDDRSRRLHLELYLGENIGKVMRLPFGTTVDAKRPFGSMGLDSLMALEMRNRLERDIGLSLRATTLFDYPTINALADHLLIRCGFISGAPISGPAVSDLNESDVRGLVELIDLAKRTPMGGA